MNYKSTALIALLVPSLAMVAACNRAPEADDATTTPAVGAMSDPPPADTMPTDTMPADSIGTTSGMAGEEMSFAAMDKNQDGGVSMDELTAADMLHQHFLVADTDADGKLSDAEVTQHRAEMAAAPGK